MLSIFNLATPFAGLHHGKSTGWEEGCSKIDWFPQLVLSFRVFFCFVFLVFFNRFSEFAFVCVCVCLDVTRNIDVYSVFPQQ